MYEITTEASFSAAHKLLNYHGPCENLHGHNWLVRATFKSDTLDKCGIAVDFKTLKSSLRSILDKFDHRNLNEVLEPHGMNPSSENIARHVFEQLKIALENIHGSVSRVEVYETPGNCAVYYE